MTQRRPPGRFDSRNYARAYSSHSPGQHSGSGSARLDLSQKGDLPSSDERALFIWSKVAGARKRPEWGKAPRRCCIAGASHVPGAGGLRLPSSGTHPNKSH